MRLEFMNSLCQPSTPSNSVLEGRVVEGPVSARITIDGRKFINFSGCGYLALSTVPEIREAVRQALDRGVPFAQQLPAAKGAIDRVFDTLERATADICRTEASVYFASGYLIGTIGLASVDPPADLLLLDEHAHYNLKDAARLSGLPTFTFAHCEVQSLRDSLRRHVGPRRRPLIVTDGVFPASGRLAPLSKYAIELTAYEGRLFVDEAHSFGVIGNDGRGAAEFCEVEQLSTMGATFSKAYCAQGAFVACSDVVARRLRTAPPIRGACAGSPLSAVAATASLAYASNHPEFRTTLHALTQYLRTKLQGLGLDVIESPMPIVSFEWGRRVDMQALQRRAFERGIFINYSTYVGSGTEGCIVCAVFRDHSRADIDALLDVLSQNAR